MAFLLKRKSARENFPFPEDKATVYETTPCLIWLHDNDNELFTVTVKDEGGTTVLNERTERNYIYPTSPLLPGRYVWNVTDSKGNERGELTFFIAEEAVTFVRPSAKDVFLSVPERIRPRHLFTKEDIDGILKNHPKEYAILKKNLELAYSHGMPKPPRYAHGGDSLPYREYFGSYRDYCDRDLIACALAYSLGNDLRAGEHGKELLLTICDMNPLGPCSIMGEWGDEVGLSNARCLPSAFDMLYPLLDEKQRRYVAETVAVYARQCEARIKKINYIKNPSNSHVGRLPAYLGEAALVLKGTGTVDDDTLISWLELALEIYNGIFPFYGCPDGSWAEGAFYSTSYTKWYLPFFSAVERFSGVSLFIRPFYMRYSQYLLHFCNEKYDVHPFGDGYWCHPTDEEWPGFFAQDPYRVYTERFGPDILKKRKEASLEKIDYFRLHLLDIFLPSPKSEIKNTLRCNATNAMCFPYGGYAVLHTDIDSDDDICVMARASRFVADSHRHRDQGSFAIFCGGRSLISPSGYFGRAYGTKHHFEWTKMTVAHNVALIDGIGQGDCVDTACSIVEFDGDRKSFTMDITPAYEGRLTKYLRSVTLDASGVTVTDRIEADDPVTVTYPLHSYREPVKLREGAVEIRSENAVMTVIPENKDLKLKEITDKYGIDLNEGEPKKYHVTKPKQYHVYYTKEAAKEHFITVRYNVKPLKLS